jgi:thiol-disulfide isomerase/thioredoxin
MDTFLVRVVPQHPDSINMELDKMLAKMNYDKSDSSDIYKYYLTHFLNHYAKSEFVGMDAVYVHLALKYYENAKTSPWLVDSVRAKIVNDARRLDPILIGKTAPNIRLNKQDGSSVALYDIKSPYTIVMIWDPECGHCKKSMPDYEKFYAEWKDKGVEIFSICNRRTEIEKCWEYIDKEEGRMNWLNLVDPYLQSRYTTLYDVKTTPKVYILNSEKKILSKGVGAEQLDSVMDQLIEMENKKLKETLKKD